MNCTDQISPVTVDEQKASPQDEILFSFDAKDFEGTDNAIAPPQFEPSDFDMVAELLSESAPYTNNEEPSPTLDPASIPLNLAEVQTSISDPGTPILAAEASNMVPPTPPNVQSSGNTKESCAEESTKPGKLLNGDQQQSADTTWIQSEALPMQEANPSQFHAQPMSSRAQVGHSPFSQVSRPQASRKLGKAPKTVRAQANTPSSAKGRKIAKSRRPRVSHLNLSIPDKLSPTERASHSAGLRFRKALFEVTNSQQQGVSVQSSPFDASLVKPERQTTASVTPGASASRTTIKTQSPNVAQEVPGMKTTLASRSVYITAAPIQRRVSEEAIVHAKPFQCRPRPSSDVAASEPANTPLAPHPQLFVKHSPALVPIGAYHSPVVPSEVPRAANSIPLPIRPTSTLQTTSQAANASVPVQVPVQVSNGVPITTCPGPVPKLTLSRIQSGSSGNSESASFASPGENVTPEPLTATENRSKMRYSEKADPSNYCHICGRAKRSITLNTCANTRLGLCRKVVCDKCLLVYQYKLYDFAKQPNSSWVCCHCQNTCPPRARCHSYKRNNQKRRARKERERNQEGGDSARETPGPAREINKGTASPAASSSRGWTARKQRRTSIQSSPAQPVGGSIIISPGFQQALQNGVAVEGNFINRKTPMAFTPSRTAQTPAPQGIVCFSPAAGQAIKVLPSANPQGVSPRHNAQGTNADGPVQASPAHGTDQAQVAATAFISDSNAVPLQEQGTESATNSAVLYNFNLNK